MVIPLNLEKLPVKKQNKTSNLIPSVNGKTKISNFIKSTPNA